MLYRFLLETDYLRKAQATMRFSREILSRSPPAPSPEAGGEGGEDDTEIRKLCLTRFLMRLPSSVPKLLKRLVAATPSFHRAKGAVLIVDRLGSGLWKLDFNLGHGEARRSLSNRSTELSGQTSPTATPRPFISGLCRLRNVILHNRSKLPVEQVPLIAYCCNGDPSAIPICSQHTFLCLGTKRNSQRSTHDWTTAELRSTRGPRASTLTINSRQP